MTRRQPIPVRARKVRTLVTAGLASAALLVIGVGAYLALQPVGDINVGEHYIRLPAADRLRRGAVVVTEYFSYGCAHCRNFEPQIEAWQAKLPENVRFERIPVAFSPAWRDLSAAYFAAQELGIMERNHSRLFDAIHRTQINLQTPAALAQFFDGHGASAERFQQVMNSPAVRNALAEAARRARTDQIQAVPTLVIDGRYRIEGDKLSRRQVLTVADQLLALELAARDGAGTSTEETGSSQDDLQLTPALPGN